MGGMNGMSGMNGMGGMGANMNSGLGAGMNSGLGQGLGMSSPYQLNSMSKFIKLENCQGMMNLDFVPQMDHAHRVADMRFMGNVSRPELMFNCDSRNYNPQLLYESDNSDEESKEMGNKREDELFLHPYSSMFRRKDA
uniref:Uncharacterized protein n=1 Tax=Euplotes harpa TaxID=151035 RepID=A0A7S3JB98_9SPIT|mmetsp:Transcript_25864/g.29835  ORF Transcript_25864/g.29835 Transcript_25864/m.29835 type:complete len:138 (+) Transcript_25864:427-840(+)